MRRLILADIKSFNNNGVNTGHYFSLARNYQELFKEKCAVKIAGGPIYRTGFKDIERLPLPFDWVRGDSRIKNVWRMLMNARHLFRNTTQKDIVVMQMASAATMFLAIALFAIKRHKIFSIQYDTEALDCFIKRIIYWFAKKKIKGIICPAKQIGEAYGKPYCVVSDYIYTKIGLQDSIPFTDKKYDFCMIGRIVPEKGIVEAAENLAGTKYKVIIAGKAATKKIEERLTEIANANNNIILKLGFVSDEDFCNYIRYSKYSLMNYQGVYMNRSSGVVLDTIFSGTPVVGNRCMALKFIEENVIGHLFDDICSFVPSLADDKDSYLQFKDNIGAYLQKHIEYKRKLYSFLSVKNK